MIKQCKFKDIEGNICGGLFCEFDNGDRYIIDACTGSTIDPEEVTDLVIYKYWGDFTEYIINEIEPLNTALEILYNKE